MELKLQVSSFRDGEMILIIRIRGLIRGRWKQKRDPDMRQRRQTWGAMAGLEDGAKERRQLEQLEKVRKQGPHPEPPGRRQPC